MLHGGGASTPEKQWVKVLRQISDPDIEKKVPRPIMTLCIITDWDATSVEISVHDKARNRDLPD